MESKLAEEPRFILQRLPQKLAVCPLVHTLGSVGEGICQAGRSAEFHSNRLCAMQPATACAFLLAIVCKAQASPACECHSVTGIQNRYSVSTPCVRATKPGSVSAKLPVPPIDVIPGAGADPEWHKAAFRKSTTLPNVLDLLNDRSPLRAPPIRRPLLLFLMRLGEA